MTARLEFGARIDTLSNLAYGSSNVLPGKMNDVRYFQLLSRVRNYQWLLVNSEGLL